MHYGLTYHHGSPLSHTVLLLSQLQFYLDLRRKTRPLIQLSLVLSLKQAVCFEQLKKFLHKQIFTSRSILLEFTQSVKSMLSTMLLKQPAEQLNSIIYSKWMKKPEYQCKISIFCPLLNAYQGIQLRNLFQDVSALIIKAHLKVPTTFTH